MKESEEIRQSIIQLNKRITNVESSARMLEQRLDLTEAALKSLESKIIKNTEKILEIILKDIPTLKSEFSSFRKYLELTENKDDQ